MAATASARRHAQAVFAIASEADSVREWRSRLSTIAERLSDPELLAILENPKLPLGDKEKIVNSILPDLDRLTLNLVYFLVSKRRLGILKDMVSEYERMADAYEGLEHAVVTTAVDLDEAEKAKLVEYLTRTSGGKRIQLSTQVDPDILGGFIARIGDRILDASTRTKLENLKRRLVTESA